MPPTALIPLLALVACGSASEPAPAAPQATGGPVADVVGVILAEDPAGHRLTVTVSSPDQGCAQYADWWEVLDSNGALLGRRILNHSHVDEQPFTRSGEPLALAPHQDIVVRAHMSNGGYGGRAFVGTLAGGLRSEEGMQTPHDAALARTEPLPTGCTH